MIWVSLQAANLYLSIGWQLATTDNRLLWTVDLLPCSFFNQSDDVVLHTQSLRIDFLHPVWREYC